MKTYTVGFVFNTTLDQVLLVHKQKPDWQVGKLNGMGGKVEDGETTPECMARECAEETLLNIPHSDWRPFATIHEGAGDNEKTVEFFTVTYSGKLSDAQKGDYEEVEWFSAASLPNNCLQNLHFLVPMARETLRGHTATITVKY